MGRKRIVDLGNGTKLWTWEREAAGAFSSHSIAEVTQASEDEERGGISKGSRIRAYRSGRENHEYLFAFEILSGLGEQARKGNIRERAREKLRLGMEIIFLRNFLFFLPFSSFLFSSFFVVLFYAFVLLCWLGEEGGGTRFACFLPKGR